MLGQRSPVKRHDLTVLQLVAGQLRTWPIHEFKHRSKGSSLALLRWLVSGGANRRQIGRLGMDRARGPVTATKMGRRIAPPAHAARDTWQSGFFDLILHPVTAAFDGDGLPGWRKLNHKRREFRSYFQTHERALESIKSINTTCRIQDFLRAATIGAGLDGSESFGGDSEPALATTSTSLTKSFLRNPKNILFYQISRPMKWLGLETNMNGKTRYLVLSRRPLGQRDSPFSGFQAGAGLSGLPCDKPIRTKVN